MLDALRDRCDQYYQQIPNDIPSQPLQASVLICPFRTSLREC